MSRKPCCQPQDDDTRQCSCQHAVVNNNGGAKSSSFFHHVRKLPSSWEHPWRRFVLNTVWYISAWFKRFTKFKVYHGERIEEYIKNRPPGEPIISVSNHQSMLDDPLLVCMTFPKDMIVNEKRCRWGWCSEEYCFNEDLPWFIHKFFLGGKILPIVRGHGLHQQGMAQAMALLERGEHFHVFPEGKCNQDISYAMSPLKWGVARLIADTNTDKDVKVLPFVHHGMQTLFPFDKPPLPGQRVRCLVGKPISFKDLIDCYDQLVDNNPGWGDPFPPPREVLYEAITERLTHEMNLLMKELKANDYAELGIPMDQQDPIKEAAK